MHTALFVLLLGISSSPTVAPAPEYEAGFSVGGFTVPGSRAEGAGVRVAFTAFSRGQDARYGFVGSYFAEWLDSDERDAVEAGLEIAFPYVLLGRIGVGPRARVALRRDFGEAFDLVGGLGGEFGVWLKPRLQLATHAERRVGFSTPAYTGLGISVRVFLWEA